MRLAWRLNQVYVRFRHDAQRGKAIANSHEVEWEIELGGIGGIDGLSSRTRLDHPVNGQNVWGEP